MTRPKMRICTPTCLPTLRRRCNDYTVTLHPSPTTIPLRVKLRFCRDADLLTHAAPYIQHLDRRPATMEIQGLLRRNGTPGHQVMECAGRCVGSGWNRVCVRWTRSAAMRLKTNDSRLIAFATALIDLPESYMEMKLCLAGTPHQQHPNQR